MSEMNKQIGSHISYNLWYTHRFASFVTPYNESRCYYSEILKPNSSRMCQFVQERRTCSQFVYYIDYLKLLFCTLNLNWNSGYTFVVALILAAQFCILYMVIKYFCLPNYIMLMKMLPVSQYTYSFVFIGTCLFTPEYLSMCVTSLYKESSLATLHFSKALGDIFRYFVLGILALCINGYHVDGVLWWSNMFYIFIGLVYVLFVVHQKYEIFGCTDLAYADSYLLQSNAEIMLGLFVMVMLVVVLISYYNRLRSLPQAQSNLISSAYLFLALPGDGDQINPMHTNLSKFQIWWQTVNGFANMTERPKIIVTVAFPFYFLLANMIPVIHKRRPMHGWCKCVVCCSFIVFPLTFTALKPGATAWLGVLICSWAMSLLICITCNALREPSKLWLIVYSISGMIMCSIVMHCCSAEIDNLLWQYLSMRFFPEHDFIVLIFFSTGKMFVIGILLGYLIRDQLHHAAYGAVMGIVTHAVHSTLPWLVLHGGYTKHIYIQFTAITDSCCQFFLVMFLGTLFHVSMCGNEFRMSLFFYLVTLLSAYLVFQLMSYFDWIHPLAEQTHIGPPNFEQVWA